MSDSKLNSSHSCISRPRTPPPALLGAKVGGASGCLTRALPEPAADGAGCGQGLGAMAAAFVALLPRHAMPPHSAPQFIPFYPIAPRLFLSYPRLKCVQHKRQNEPRSDSAGISGSRMPLPASLETGVCRAPGRIARGFFQPGLDWARFAAFVVSMLGLRAQGYDAGVVLNAGWCLDEP
ncbi:hypothetical protein DL767_001161 [Monosporascus sp. MG133]|nr:hypothetical protein DL767_001161 [Monosporascus sp. MG133]